MLLTVHTKSPLHYQDSVCTLSSFYIGAPCSEEGQCQRLFSMSHISCHNRVMCCYLTMLFQSEDDFIPAVFTGRLKQRNIQSKRNY